MRLRSAEPGFRLAFLALGVALAACSTTPESKQAASDGSLQALGAESVVRGRGAPEVDRLMIRSGSIEVEVAALDAGVEAVKKLVAQLGGHVLHATAGSESAHLSVKVPSPDLELFLDRVAALGEEASRSIHAADVTDQYSDLEAEIANTRAFRDRLRVLLERADKVEDVLNVERELTRVQTQLDMLEARQKRMGADIELSTVDVSLTPEPEPRILGPLGLLWEGTRWLVVKLFVISP
jgi:hypothetical protein